MRHSALPRLWRERKELSVSGACSLPLIAGQYAQVEIKRGLYCPWLPAVQCLLWVRLCCKSRFSPMTKILRAVGATLVYKMRGSSRPHAKFTGDFGNAIEVIRISHRLLLSVFAKNLEPATFEFCNTIGPGADIGWPLPQLNLPSRSAGTANAKAVT